MVDSVLQKNFTYVANLCKKRCKIVAKYFAGFAKPLQKPLQTYPPLLVVGHPSRACYEWSTSAPYLCSSDSSGAGTAPSPRWHNLRESMNSGEAHGLCLDRSKPLEMKGELPMLRRGHSSTRWTRTLQNHLPLEGSNSWSIHASLGSEAASRCIFPVAGK
jgi:hypothetical protein